VILIKIFEFIFYTAIYLKTTSKTLKSTVDISATGDPCLTGPLKNTTVCDQNPESCSS